MLVYIKSKKAMLEASAEYDLESKKITVLKGSRLSPDISAAPSFRNAKAFEKARAGKVEDDILTEDVEFNSPSTAATFVVGSCRNGWIAWKTAEGKTLREAIQ